MGTQEFIKSANRKLAPKVVKNLQARHFDAYFCETADEALEKAIELIDKNGTVAWGGTMTATEIGLLDRLKNDGYNCIDRNSAKTEEERIELMQKAVFSDTFIMSSNAVSYDGQLVNIDGFGNRVCAMIYGAKSVVMVVGMNKVMPTLEDAITRARTVAAPRNMQRFSGKNTPCAVCDSCGDCVSEDSICCHEVITRVGRPAGRIKVILVNEELGL